MHDPIEALDRARARVGLVQGHVAAGGTYGDARGEELRCCAVGLLGLDIAIRNGEFTKSNPDPYYIRCNARSDVLKREFGLSSRQSETIIGLFDEAPSPEEGLESVKQYLRTSAGRPTTT